MNYRSIARLNLQMAQWVSQLPRDIDLIVGIPRSGMLVANMLALHLNLPFADLDGFLEGRIIKSGSRRGSETNVQNVRHALIVDDSLNEGGQLAKARQRVEAANLGHAVSFAVAYVRPGTEPLVDFYVEAVDVPRVFEWNIMHHAVLKTSCLDIDGVFCLDPTDDDDDDGERYEHFLATAKPLIIPTVPVGWLVTCRLEKYRALTEQWMTDHGVVYRELVMMDHEDKAARQRSESHSSYKASVYRATSADLFIESSLSQSISIANLSGRNVFCVETREMVEPIAESTQLNLQPWTASSAPSPASASGRSNDWAGRLQSAVGDILRLIPVGATFVLADENQWAVQEVFAGRRSIPFTSRDGRYWGPPTDDTAAIEELDQSRRKGADFFVFGWPAFWWFDHYAGLINHLRDNYRCLVANNELVIFDLNEEPVPTDSAIRSMRGETS